MSRPSSIVSHTGAASPPSDVAPPVTLSERSLTGLALVRIFAGLLFLQQLSWKMPPTFGDLHRYIVSESQHTFLPGYSFLLQHLFLPNFTLLASGVWLTELLVGVSLILGLFTRLGAVLATILAAQLYVGLAFAPGEWYWTYGMLVLLGVVLIAVPAGRRLGLDQSLGPWLHQATLPARLGRVLRWSV